VILDVDDIATDADLASEVGDVARLGRAMPRVESRNAIRADALNDVVRSLATRTPAIRPELLTDPTELKKAVVYRALSKIFLGAVSVDGDLHTFLSQRYEREYQSAVRGAFTVYPGVTGPSGSSFSYERR
jgi:hypothetical protein